MQLPTTKQWGHTCVLRKSCAPQHTKFKGHSLEQLSVEDHAVLCLAILLRLSEEDFAVVCPLHLQALGCRPLKFQECIHGLCPFLLYFLFVCLCRHITDRHAFDDLICLPLEDTLVHINIWPAFARQVVSHRELVCLIRFSCLHKCNQVFACTYASVRLHSRRMACCDQLDVVLAADALTVQTYFEAIDAIRNFQVTLVHNSDHQLDRLS